MRKLILSLMLCAATTVFAAQPKTIYDFTMNSIDGQPVSLGSYSGKVVLLVNVPASAASRRNMRDWNRFMRSTRIAVL